MLNSLQNELNHIIDRGLDRHLRIAVTGLSGSGKTAFITSLINQLFHINQIDNSFLPLFEPARTKRIIKVKRLEQADLSIPSFDYQANLKALMGEPAQFPQSTRDVSEIRLEISYQRQSGLLSYVKQKGKLYLDIFDYPGEWLLDLPLLELNFEQWSQQMAELQQGRRLELAQDWLSKLQHLDLYAPADENHLAELAKSYTEYLFACKKEGMHFIQPGRFVLAGQYEGSPALQFFPLVHLSPADWKKLKDNADNNSYFARLNKHYEYYRQHIVQQEFYQKHFVKFDRQVILADCLTPLNHSQQAFIDMQQALQQLFKNFHYGKRHFWHRLFSARIDKLMFVASKADHITTDQLPNLISLMRQLVQSDGQHQAFDDIETEYSAISAIRCTQQVNVTENGKSFKAIQGEQKADGVNGRRFVTVFPGAVPNRLPKADFWQKQGFEFDQFLPQNLDYGSSIPHLRMDGLLQFLLGDKLD